MGNDNLFSIIYVWLIMLLTTASDWIAFQEDIVFDRSQPNYGKVSRYLGTRTTKQCYERYVKLIYIASFLIVFNVKWFRITNYIYIFFRQLIWYNNNTTLQHIIRYHTALHPSGKYNFLSYNFAFFHYPSCY